MRDVCEHLVGYPADVIEPEGCESCLEIGGTWVNLRMCLDCGRIGCCDSSPNRHASGHARDTGHVALRSAQPGELWVWCFEHEVSGELPT